MERGQILVALNEYWEDATRSNALYCQSVQGLEIREKRRSSLYQVKVLCIAHFYFVEEVVGEYVRLSECEKEKDFGGARVAYFDTPYSVAPRYDRFGLLESKGSPFRRKVRKDESGEEFVQVESYLTARLWNREPVREFNLH